MAVIGLGRYTLLSMLAAGVVIYHAFATREYFYPATVYLSTSKIAVAVLGNLLFASAMCIHRALIKVFFGSLRDLEVEMVRERLSSAVMESLLALTIFREEFGAFFVAMFATLVFVKVMHWLVQDRVDYVEVTPSVSVLQHMRLVSFMSTLLLVDILFLQYTIHGTIQSSGQSVMLLFAFEYIIQASNIIRYFLKYIMSVADMSLEGRWESKSIYVFYLDLVTDLLHLFVYCVFFLLVYSNYGLPLHLVRDLYSTFRNFRNRIVDFLRFRAVTARLDRFPDASAEDLQRSDGVCIICREEMYAAGANKKLFCGHVFHLHCLRSWLERQQNCPTCRASVFRRPDPPAPAAGQQGAAAAAPAAPAAQPDQVAQPAAGAAAAPAPAAAGPAGAAAAAAPQPARHHPLHHFHVPPVQHRVRLAVHPAVHRAAPAPGQQQQDGPGGGAAQPSAGTSAAPAMMPPGMGMPPGGFHPAAFPQGYMMPMMQPWMPFPGMPMPMAAPAAGHEGEAPAFIPVGPFPLPPGFMGGMLPMGTGSLESQAAAIASAAAWAATAAVHAPPPGYLVMGPTHPVAAGAANSDAGASDSLEAAHQALQQQMRALLDHVAQLSVMMPAMARAVAQTAPPAPRQQSEATTAPTEAEVPVVTAVPGPLAAASGSEQASTPSTPATATALASSQPPSSADEADGEPVAVAREAAGSEQAPTASGLAPAASDEMGAANKDTNSGADEGSDEQAEIRRRRLQRFEQAGQQ